MKKQIGFLLLLVVGTVVHASAQYGGYGRPGRGRVIIRSPRPQRPRPPQQVNRNQPAFEPTVNLSFGYGFPNADQYQMTEFYNAYKGKVNQTGPFMAALDYQFSRNMSIGVMATHGKVSAPYYYNNVGSFNPPSFTGELENTAIMLNVVSYFPASKSVSPYLRTAAGVNIWEQNYIDNSGAHLNYIEKPSSFAYQASLGMKINLSKGAGLFVEAGYGKYILNGGLAFKF